MKRIIDITQLHPGDKIVRVFEDDVQILEFVCLNPHNELYSIMLNQNCDGTRKFYNLWLPVEKWFLYEGSDDDWLEIIDMQIEAYKRDIERLQARRIRFEKRDDKEA